MPAKFPSLYSQIYHRDAGAPSGCCVKDRFHSFACVRAVWFFLAALLFWLSATPIRAQPVVLYLRGGDRISGTIISEDTNRVVIATKWAKELVVPLAEIVKREAPGTANASDSKQSAAKGPPGITGALTNAAPRPGTAAVSGPLPPTKPKIPRHWTGEAQMGMDLALSERKRQLYSGRAKVAYVNGHFRNIFDYTFGYGKTDGLLSDNRMYGTSKTDYDFSSRFYLYNLGGAGYDEIRKIDLRWEAGPGLGYRVMKLTNFVLNTELGVNYQAQYQSDNTRTELFFFRLAENTAWTINGRFSVDEKFEFFPRVEEWTKYRFRLESNVRLALSSHLSLVGTVLDQYDTQPALGVQHNDLQLRSSLSVKF